MILVSFTVAMFALATAYLALSLSSTFNAFLRGETASIQWGTEKGDRSVLPVALEVLNVGHIVFFLSSFRVLNDK